MVLFLILVILAYLFGVFLMVSWKKDLSIANFTWGAGLTLLALCTLPLTGNRILDIVYILMIWSAFAELIKYICGTAYSKEAWTPYLYIFLIFFAAYLLAKSGDFIARPLLATMLTGIWASRMLAHLYSRYTGKDPRFTLWRQQEGIKALMMHLGYIVGGQSLLMLIMATPVVLINTRSGQGLNLFDIFGCIVWVTGFLFEAVADYQLFMFMKNPTNNGKLMRSGLWQYSRHPNYFGEVVLWWGMYCFALSVPGGWVAIIAPLTITVLLLFVTGIPWAEKVLAQNPEFDDYKRRTSIFIPWLPKKQDVL